MPRKRTGTVQFLGGRWQGRVTLEDGTRKWVDVSRGEQITRAEAKRRTASTSREIDKAEAPAGIEETVSQYAERWLKARTEKCLKSVKDDAGRMNNWILPVIGKHAVRTITSKEIRALVASLDASVRAEEMSWKSAQNTWGITSKMFADACKSKIESLRVREDNPALNVTPPDRGSKKSRAYLYPNELLALVSCERVPLRWRRLFALAVYTYTRRGELEALEWGDVDLDRGTVNVHCATDRETGEVRQTKTGETRRFLLEREIVPLLKQLRKECGGVGRVFPGVPPAEDLAAYLRKCLVFAGVTRRELFADDATRAPLTFHDLRATGITWMAVRGDEPLKIQRRAGHTTLSTTQRYIREAESLGCEPGEVFPPLPTLPLGIESSNDSSKESGK